MLQAHTGINRQAKRYLLDGIFRVLQPILVCVEFLVLAALAGEEDQPSFIRLQAGDIEREGLFGEIGAAAVDRNADRGGQLAGDACFLLCIRSVIRFSMFPLECSKSIPSTPTM
jgi:hypothetical protein